MAAGVDQFWADGAHGAIVRGERFIELCHVSADGGLGFHQVDLEALVSQIEAGLHTGDATADDQDRSDGSGRVVLGPIEGVCLRPLL